MKKKEEKVMTTSQTSMSKRLIAWLLTLCLVITLIPDIGYAAENADSDPSVMQTENANQTFAESSEKEQEQMLDAATDPAMDGLTEENVIEKTETTTVYDIGDGKKAKVIHGGEVRFENEKGKLVDYDPSLVKITDIEKTENGHNLDGYKFTNKIGDKKQYLPKKLSESTPVLMEYDGYHMTLVPTVDTVKTLGLESRLADVEEDVVPSIYEGDGESMPVNAVYGEKDDAAVLTYTSGDAGIKETLTLNERPETNVFTYEFFAGDLLVKENIGDEGITVIDPQTDDIVAGIEAPWMNDATGDAYSTDIRYDLEQTDEEGRYIITMTIDAEYLDDIDRVYPVTVDPTVTWKGNDMIRDTYIITGSGYAGTNFYDTSITKMPVGKNSTGTHRTLFKILNLKAEIEGKSVDSAKLTLYESGTGASGQTVRANRLIEDWSPSTVTWNNQPEWNTAAYTDQVTTSGTKNTAKVFDCTAFARNVSNGTSNYGLILRNMTTNPSYACFWGSRYATTSYRPKLVVTYYDSPTVHTSSNMCDVNGNQTSYFDVGSACYVSWSGITAYEVDAVQYKFVAASDEASVPTAAAGSVDLTSYRSIGSTAKSATAVKVPYSSYIPRGSYKLYLRVKDAAGNVSSAKYLNVYYDGGNPVINSVTTSPSTGTSSYTTNVTPTISWDVTELFLKSVDIVVTNNSETLYSKSLTTSAVKSSHTVPSGKLKTGTNAIKVTFRDQVGNTVSKTINYYVDLTAPTIGAVGLTNSSGADIASKYTNDTNPKVTFTNVTDNCNIANSCLKYAIRVKGSTATLTYKTPTNISINSAKPYSGYFTLNDADRSLATGNYEIFVQATDQLGNKSSSKSVEYLIDKDKPTGTISITEQGTGAAVTGTELKNTPNINISASDSVSGVAKMQLKLYKVANNGTETQCRDFGVVTKTENYDLNTSQYENGEYRLKLYIEDNAGNNQTVSKDVKIANPMDAPTLSAVNTKNGIANITWSLKDMTKVAKLQYKLESSSNWIDVAKPASGSSGTIAVTFTTEGKHNVQVRAVDTSGVNGKISTVSSVYDKTAPTVDLTDYDLGYLKGTISDANNLEWTLAVKEKNAADSTYETIGSGTSKVSNGNIVFIDLSDNRYEEGKEYVFRITATDLLGNSSYDTYNIIRPIGEAVSSRVAAEFSVDKTEKQPDGHNSNCTVYSADITEMTLDSAPLTGTTSWYVDNVRKATGDTYADNFASYEVYKEYPLLVINKKSNGTRLYSSPIITNAEVAEFTVPSGQSSFETAVNQKGHKVLSLRVYGTRSGATYQVKTGNKSYVTVEMGETVYIDDLFDGMAYAEDLTVKVISTNIAKSNDITVQMDIVDSEEESFFEISTIEKYKPLGITATSKINYKSYVKWGNTETSGEIKYNQVPENIYYEVYRGTTADFTPNSSNLAATGIRAGYFCEINVDYSEGFYYKVRAVHEINGKKYHSSFSDERFTNVVDADEYTKRMGVKEYWEFAEIETPNGDISIEKSMGNMVYQQTDALIPNEQMEVELTRTYNSQSSAKSAFGVGWSHDYDVELLKICNDNLSDDSDIIMKDGSGTIYHFMKNGDSYNSSLGKYITLVKEEKNETVKLPKGKSGIIENGDQVETVSIVSSYTMTTKDNLEYRFNSGGQLVYMKEANGNFILFRYDAEKGTLKEVVTNNNLSMEFTYCNDENSDRLLVSELKLPNDSSIKYEYEGNPARENMRLIKVTHVATNGEMISYEYDYDNSSIPNINHIYDALGNDYEIKYNDEDQATDVIYPDGESVRLQYDAAVSDALQLTADDVTNVEDLNTELTTITSKIINGKVVSSEEDTFNDFGNCISSIDTEGYETKYEYIDHLLSKTTTETDSYYIDSTGYVKQSDKQEKVETTTYDSNENEDVEVEEDGTVTDYGYNQDANDYTDDLPVTETETTKDENGNTVEVFDLSYEYDTFGNETKEYDEVSDITTVTDYYGANETGKDGCIVGEIEFEKEYLGTEDTGKLQNTTTYKYYYHNDGSKTEVLIQKCGDEPEITITTVYDSMGNEIKTEDSRGKITENTFDGFGRLINTKYTDGDIVTYESKEYDSNGMVKKDVAQDGTVTSYTYDNMNRIKTKTITKGSFAKTWTISYGYETIQIHNGSGTPVEIKDAFYTKEVDPDNKIVSIIYQDGLGRTVKQYENGIYVDLSYDGQGNVLTQYEYSNMQDQNTGLLTMFIYDSAGNLTDMILNPEYVVGKGYYTGGNAIVTSSEYDPSGNEIATIDGKGNKTEFDYDVEGNITSVKLPNGKTTTYQYDVLNADGTTSNITIDAKGHKSEIISDESDLDILVQDLGNGNVNPIKTSFLYDSKENVTRETDSEGNYRTYEYDGKDRMIAAHYFDSSKNETLKTTYSYDMSDNLIEMRDYRISNGNEILVRVTKYTYDELKRLVGYAEVDGPAEPTADDISAATISYHYDFEDNLVRIDYPETGSNVKALNFTYNEYNWITGITADTGGVISKAVRDYVYSSDGKIKQIKDYKGVLTGESGYIVREYSYDEFERTTGIVYKDSSNLAITKESHSYEYDKNNNITKETIINNWPSYADNKVNEVRVHNYNSIDQLIKTTITDNNDNSVAEISYSYDEVGNRTKEIEKTTKGSNSQTKTIIYNYNSLNQITSSNEDTEGVNTSSMSYSYDKNGNQVNETDGVTGESRTMTYDTAGNMSRLVAKTGNTITLTQENVYNGNGQRIKKTEADNTNNYYYQGANVLYTTDGTGALSAQNLVGISENTIATTRGTGDSEAYYVYTKDIRESTTNLVDSSGASEVSYEYTDYGETEITGNEEFYNEICYTEGIYDASTGIYYLNARYYDPENANFLSQDSYRGEIGDPESLNYYAYCYGNPITYTDPSGHIPVLVVVAVKVGARIIVKHVVKKAAKKYVKKTVKKSIKKYVKKTVKKKVTKSYKKPKKSKVTKKKNNKTNKKSRAKSSTKKTNKKKNVSKAKKQSQKEVQQRSKGGCFVAGTMISTDDGFMPIEEIKVGDRVWSEDTATGEKALKKVKKVFVREKDSIIRLTINGEVIETTEEHPFWIKNQGWIPAGSLNAGDIVKLQSGEYVLIEEYKVVILDEPIPVYNFHVEDYECYYVSDQKVLVHNNNSCAQTNTKHGNQRIKERGFSQKQIDDIIKNYSQKVYQSGGRTVYAKKNNGYYDVVITNSNGQIITTVGGKTKSLKTWKAVTKMLNNNGGYSSLPIG